MITGRRAQGHAPGVASIPPFQRSGDSRDGAEVAKRRVLYWRHTLRKRCSREAYRVHSRKSILVTTHSPQLAERARRVDDIVARLRASGHRLTPQRHAVVRALVDGAHPSAEQLYQHVVADYPMMSPATVYKTIDALKLIGEVLELEFREGPNRYDANMPTPHPHAICTRCGRIDDVTMDRLDDAMSDAAAQTAFAVHGYRLDFYGLCPGCAGKSPITSPS